MTCSTDSWSELPNAIDIPPRCETDPWRESLVGHVISCHSECSCTAARRVQLTLLPQRDLVSVCAEVRWCCVGPQENSLLKKKKNSTVPIKKQEYDFNCLNWEPADQTTLTVHWPMCSARTRSQNSTCTQACSVYNISEVTKRTCVSDLPASKSTHKYKQCYNESWLSKMCLLMVNMRSAVKMKSHKTTSRATFRAMLAVVQYGSPGISKIVSFSNSTLCK